MAIPSGQPSETAAARSALSAASGSGWSSKVSNICLACGWWFVGMQSKVKLSDGVPWVELVGCLAWRGVLRVVRLRFGATHIDRSTVEHAGLNAAAKAK